MTDLSVNSYQSRVYRWALDCFGYGHVTDIRERACRFVEEALELGQVCQMSRADAHALVDYVYARDPGQVKQEIGGVMVTLGAICAVLGVSMEDAGEQELARVMLPEVMAIVRAKQAQKAAAGFGGALPGELRSIIRPGGNTHMEDTPVEAPAGDAAATPEPESARPAAEPAAEAPAEGEGTKTPE